MKSNKGEYTPITLKSLDELIKKSQAETVKQSKLNWENFERRTMEWLKEIKQ